MKACCSLSGDPHLLVFGTTDDPHVERVVERVRRAGVPTTILDHNERSTVTVSQDTGGRTVASICGQSFDPCNPNLVVWSRSKTRPTVPFFFPNKTNSYDGVLTERLSERTLSYLAAEWTGTYGLLHQLFMERTRNDPVAVWRFRSKLMQHQAAGAVGFQTPATLLTNALLEARQFASQGSTIVKSHANPLIDADPDVEDDVPGNMVTMRVVSHDFDDTTTEQFKLVPSLLQRMIEKKYELRVCYVAGRIFSFRVDSQKFRVTSVDWRYGTGFLGFRPWPLSQKVEDRISSLMQAMGLFSGFIDLIVDPEGHHWFLEVNPDGAWAWLDDIVDGAISDHFASCLCNEVLQEGFEKDSIT